MAAFDLPAELIYNRGKVLDPKAYASEVGCASWLCLTGEEFAALEDGLSFADVQEAVPHSVNVASDPPRTLDLELARRHVTALDELPRPTLITCRMGPRASAAAYMYAGLTAGADPQDVLAAADKDEAPFCGVEEYRKWVTSSIEALRDEPR